MEDAIKLWLKVFVNQIWYVWINQLVEMMLPFYHLPFGAKSSLSTRFPRVQPVCAFSLVVSHYRLLRWAQRHFSNTIDSIDSIVGQEKETCPTFIKRIIFWSSLPPIRNIEFILVSDWECGKASTGRPRWLWLVPQGPLVQVSTKPNTKMWSQLTNGSRTDINNHRILRLAHVNKFLRKVPEFQVC